jgi:hypothetical protein
MYIEGGFRTRKTEKYWAYLQYHTIWKTQHMDEWWNEIETEQVYVYSCIQWSFIERVFIP